MSEHSKQHNLSFIVLILSLIIVTILFSVRIKYSQLVFHLLTALQLCIIYFTAWKVGGFAILQLDIHQKLLATSGLLLITSWALFSFLPGVAPPGMQSHEENQLRYLILFLNAVCIAGGFTCLAKTLYQKDEQFFSTSGFSAIVVATPMYLVWAVFMIEIHRVIPNLDTSEIPNWVYAISDLTDILLFFGGIFTYIATLFFTLSLREAKFLSHKFAQSFIFVSVLALICLSIRGFSFPDPSVAFTNWFTIPGYIFGIPAIPWIIPTIIGVKLLRKVKTN